MRTQASRAISELLEDDDFQQLITDRLEEDPTFWTGSGKRRTVITVEVDDGHVTLNGVVRTRMDRRRAPLGKRPHQAERRKTREWGSIAVSTPIPSLAEVWRRRID